MLIRKNTKAFKSILEIVTACQTRADREKLVRLYITKAGHTVGDRISVEGIQSESNLFYEMNYQTVLNSLTSSHHQLHSSEEIPGLYFFRSTTNKTWDETPFEFDPAIENEFASVPELPVTRKKEKAQKFSLPTAMVKSTPPSNDKLKGDGSRSEKKIVTSEKKTVTSVKKEETVAPKKETTKTKKPIRHNYKLRHEIEFTDLTKILFRQANLDKKAILDYYYNVSGILLPWLEQRPVSVLRAGELKNSVALSPGLFINADEESLPKWVGPTTKSKGHEKPDLLCSDLEQLMFYVEKGCVQFNASQSTVKSIDSPDYIIIVVESPDHEISRAVAVTLVMNEVLTALKLPSFVKLGDSSTLHVYVPLDSKSDVSTARQCADYLCRLIRLKTPKMVAIKGDDNEEYGKVVLDASYNDKGKSVVAPYSIIAAHAPLIAAPLLWEDVRESLNPEELTTETIFKRYKKTGDPFKTMFKTKANASTLLKKLDEHYSFLV
jgi:DNA ligase D-like protein (predicted polymerase)